MLDWKNKLLFDSAKFNFTKFNIRLCLCFAVCSFDNLVQELDFCIYLYAQ